MSTTDDHFHNCDEKSYNWPTKKLSDFEGNMGLKALCQTLAFLGKTLGLLGWLDNT